MNATVPSPEKAIQALLDAGDSTEAVAEAVMATTADPSNAVLQDLLGRGLLQTGEYAKACLCFQTAVALDPDQAVDTYRWSVLLAVENGLLENGVEVARRALARLPDDPLIIGYAGALRYRIDPADAEAVTLMSRALALEPFQWGTFQAIYVEAMIASDLRQEALEALLVAAASLELHHPWSQVHVSTLYYVAKLQHALGRLAELRETLATLISADPAIEPLVHGFAIDAFSDGKGGPLEAAADYWAERFNTILAGKDTALVSVDPDLEGARSAALNYIIGGRYRMLPANRIGKAEVERLVAAGVSRDFLDLVKSGPQGCLRATSPNAPGKAWRSDPLVAPRVRDTLDSLDRGAKASVNPFTGQVQETRHMLGADVFYFAQGDSPYLVCQWGETDTTFADTFWILPTLKLVIYFPQTNILKSTARAWLASLYERVLGNQDAAIKHLAGPIDRIVVSQHPIPHIGHYVWNGVSGWSPFFRYCPRDKLPDAIAFYGNLRLMADVTELYAEACEAVGEIILFADEAAGASYPFDTHCLLLTLKDDYITQDLAQRMIRWAYANVTPEFSDRLAEMRSRCFPLFLVNVRLGNRSWIEQKDGWVELLNALAQEYPGVGFILDGINAGVTQGWTHAQMSVAPEYELAQHLIASCPGVPVMSSIGCSISESLVVGDQADAFIGHVGAGMAKYRWVSNLPGVAFSNETFSRPNDRDGRLYDHYREQARKALHVARDSVRDVVGPKYRTPNSNFSMDWRDLHKIVRRFMAANY